MGAGQLPGLDLAERYGPRQPAAGKFEPLGPFRQLHFDRVTDAFARAAQLSASKDEQGQHITDGEKHEDEEIETPAEAWSGPVEWNEQCERAAGGEPDDEDQGTKNAE